MINKSFSLGYFPSPLRTAKVIPIFKEGDREICSNWRPISITCCTAKLIEKLVKKRLLSFLTKHNILTDSQFGYREQHSTTHAILNITDTILRNFDKKKHTVSIFLDVSKGFDCVNHDILLKKLHHYGIRGMSLKFFESYLTNRSQQTLVNGLLSDFLTVVCGVPQGSVLGPLLFLIYTNDLTNASNFLVNLFADDTCLSLSSNNLPELELQCNAQAALVDEWFRTNRLTTNSKKASNFILSKYYTRGDDGSNPDFSIKMGKVMLKKVKSVKYLGVMLDEDVSWNEQIEFLSTKLSRSAGIFSKLRYYVSKDMLIKVYHALFNSHLQYAILCWGNATATLINRLQVLQNRAIRNMFKIPRYSRLNNYYLNYRILKVDDLFDLEVGKFLHAHSKNCLPNCFSDFFQEIASVHQYNTRASSNRNYNTISCRSSRGQKSIKYYGPKIWNDIPNSCRDLPKIAFKKQFKNIIFSKF